jgi:hypothetical protein
MSIYQSPPAPPPPKSPPPPNPPQSLPEDHPESPDEPPSNGGKIKKPPPLSDIPFPLEPYAVFFDDLEANSINSRKIRTAKEQQRRKLVGLL